MGQAQRGVGGLRLAKGVDGQDAQGQPGACRTPAVLQHYVVRAVLVQAQVAPWRYGPFLEAMTERLLLRRSGSGYLFVPRLLRDYLADRAPLTARDTLDDR